MTHTRYQSINKQLQKITLKLKQTLESDRAI